MRLKTRIEIPMLAIVAASFGLAYLGQAAIFSCFVKIEHAEAKADMRRCIAAIDREAHHLKKIVTDWSNWDDTYTYVHDGNHHYESSNLTASTFASADIDLLALLNAGGRIVWGGLVEPGSGASDGLRPFPPADWPAREMFQRLAGRPTARAGVCPTPYGPMMVASGPILRSDSSGPERGTLLMGRLLDIETIQALQSQTGVTFAIRSIGDPSIPESEGEIFASSGYQLPLTRREEEANQLLVYDTYPGLDGAPALALRAEIPRRISAGGRVAASVAAASMLAGCLALLLFLRLYLQRAVVTPIQGLMNQVVSICRKPDTHARLAPRPMNEVQVLAAEFNGMLERLEEDRARRERAERALEISVERQTVLLREANHRVKNNLTAIVSMLHKEEDRAEREGNVDLLPVLNDVIARVFGLSTVHTLLSQNGWQPLPLSELCEKVVRAAMQGAPGDRHITIRVDAFPATVASDHARNIALIVNELATNTVKHALRHREDIEIRVEFQRADGKVHLRYRDNGPGFSETFLRGESHGTSIGYELIRGIAARSLGGVVELFNEGGAVTDVSCLDTCLPVAVEV